MASDSEEFLEFRWAPQPAAAEFVASTLADCRARCEWIDRFADRLRVETGTRLLDWIDHLVLPQSAETSAVLARSGFASLETGDETLWRHPAGMFPQWRLIMGAPTRVYLKAESVVDFLFAQRLLGRTHIAGDPLAAVRAARVAASNDVECWVIERHGDRGLDADDGEAVDPHAVLFHRERLLLRLRHAPQSAGFDDARRRLAAAAAELGMPRTCDLFFAAERAYWQSRNQAARVQKARQDALGLGWANHDHHTYRSSRECFAELISVLEFMGFDCRERFYAGRSAGWGAQVLEHPDCGIVIFADVDLSPDEVAGDFAHEPLPARDALGTVGLWCRLHGEAFLQAGMHHLECQFDFDAARAQLGDSGIDSMKPFTDLPCLRQSFTRGEVWPVVPERIDALLREGHISADDADRFRTVGAIGSHLEVLQREEGYKGFNQTGIDEIILKTDPRNAGTSSPHAIEA